MRMIRYSDGKPDKYKYVPIGGSSTDSRERSMAFREVTVTKYQLLQITVGGCEWSGWCEELNKWVPTAELHDLNDKDLSGSPRA